MQVSPVGPKLYSRQPVPEEDFLANCTWQFSAGPYCGVLDLTKEKTGQNDRCFLWWSNGDLNPGPPACKAGALAN